MSYSGPLTAIDAALEGMTYSAPPGFRGNLTLSLEAESQGAMPVQAQIPMTVGVFVVTSTADSGPGSLRQAILDSNAASGGTNTIDFDIAGQGIQTIVLGSPLPGIGNPVVIDGTSQPGYAGAALIAVLGSSASGPDALTIAGTDATVRGLSLTPDGFALAAGTGPAALALPAVPVHPEPGGMVDTYRIDTTDDELLVAEVAPHGVTTELTLLDSQGQILVRSSGLSAANPENVIDLDLAAGTYFLEVQSTGATGNYSLTATVTPASPLSQPLNPYPQRPLPTSAIIDFHEIAEPDNSIPFLVPQVAAGDFTGNGILDLATPAGIFEGIGDGTFRDPATGLGLPDLATNYTAIMAADLTGNGTLDLVLTDGITDTVTVLVGNGDGTFQAPVQYAVGLDPVSVIAGDFTGNGKLDVAVADAGSDSVSVLLGNGDGTFQPAMTFAAGSTPEPIVDGDFSGDGTLDLAVVDSGSNEVSILLGNGDGTFQAQWRTRWVRTRLPWWPGTSAGTVSSTWQWRITARTPLSMSAMASKRVLAA